MGKTLDPIIDSVIPNHLQLHSFQFDSNSVFGCAIEGVVGITGEEIGLAHSTVAQQNDLVGDVGSSRHVRYPSTSQSAAVKTVEKIPEKKSFNAVIRRRFLPIKF